VSSVQQIDIPLISWFEQEVFTEAHRLNAFAIATENVLANRGMTRDALPPPPYLQTRVLSCLYLLLVFPKELWAGTSTEHTVIDRLTKNTLLAELSGGDVKKFLRHIRNSIAHARVDISTDGSTEFVDKNSSGKVTFRKNLNFVEIQTLISVVGSTFAELRQEPFRAIGLQQLRGKS
jgi:HEPN pEK499 p136